MEIDKIIIINAKSEVQTKNTAKNHSSGLLDSSAHQKVRQNFRISQLKLCEIKYQAVLASKKMPELSAALSIYLTHKKS